MRMLRSTRRTQATAICLGLIAIFISSCDKASPPASESTVEVDEATSPPRSPDAADATSAAESAGDSTAEEPTAAERQSAAREKLAQDQQDKHVHRKRVDEQELSAAARLGRRLFYENRISHPGANLTASCRSCHLPPDASEGRRAFADMRPRSVTPSNSRGMKLETIRNTPTLLNVSKMPFLNHDGEFTSLADLLGAKIVSTHFGWLSEDRELALNEIWAMVLNDMGEDKIAEGSYAEQFQSSFDKDIMKLPREETIGLVIDALIAYLDTLKALDTGPYDGFAYLNRIGGSVDFEDGDDPQAFSGRLFGRLANQEGRVLVKFPTGFTEEAYQGLKIFYATEGRAHVGNCVACHYPPDFTDYSFHNTGVSQEAYDKLFGADSFLELALPDRADDPARKTRAFPREGSPGTADLGYWNYASEEEMRDEIAAFKTPSLRNLGYTDPYMHNGGYATLEEAIAQKMRAAELARAGTLRNPNPELAKIRISEPDIAPLVAFLETLDELDKDAFRQIVLDAEIRPDPFD